MLKYMDEGKSTLEREIDKILKAGDISVNTLEKLHTLTDTYKNLCKIHILSEDSEIGNSYGRGYSSYDDDLMYSERSGRGRNAPRDSMGRYSRDGGSSYDDGYSRNEGKDRMMSKLGEMMENAADPKERQALKECMRALERY